jgi:hypothetical protein
MTEMAKKKRPRARACRRRRSSSFPARISATHIPHPLPSCLRRRTAPPVPEKIGHKHAEVCSPPVRATPSISFETRHHLSILHLHHLPQSRSHPTVTRMREKKRPRVVKSGTTAKKKRPRVRVYIAPALPLSFEVRPQLSIQHLYHLPQSRRHPMTTGTAQKNGHRYAKAPDICPSPVLYCVVPVHSITLQYRTEPMWPVSRTSGGSSHGPMIT